VLASLGSGALALRGGQAGGDPVAWVASRAGSPGPVDLLWLGSYGLGLYRSCPVPCVVVLGPGAECGRAHAVSGAGLTPPTPEGETR